MRYPFIVHEADTDTDPQGGSSGEGKQRPTDVLDRYGRDALKLAEKLAEALSDNYTLREQRRTLRQENTDLKSKAAPEGTRILSADDAKVYDAYAALGKPDAIKQAMDANGEATTKLARLEREQLLGKAATASGFKSGVLERLAGDLPIEVRDVDGKPAAFVKDDKGERLLTEHATAAWADFLPALRAESGTPYVTQSAGGALQPPLNAAQSYINRIYKKQERT